MHLAFGMVFLVFGISEGIFDIWDVVSYTWDTGTVYLIFGKVYLIFGKLYLISRTRVRRRQMEGWHVSLSASRRIHALLLACNIALGRIVD